MTAFEELKAWCEKYLPTDDYQVVEESRSYAQTIYFDMFNDAHPYMCFDDNGAFGGAGVLTDEDRLEHIRDLGETECEN